MIRSLPSWRHVAGVAIVSLVAVTVPSVALTNASWNDVEFVAGTTSTMEQCATNTDLNSRSSARFLTGTLGSGPTNSLDTLAGVTGVVASNNGTAQSAVAGTPGASPSNGGYAAPLSATAINGVLQTGTSVSLPLTWPTGVYQQYARALDTGYSNSAAGAVSNSGAIDTGAPGLSPGIGSLSLSTLPGIGTTLGTLTDVSVAVGAVASSASLDGCGIAWTGAAPTTDELKRNYLVSSLNANLTSPAVAGLFNTTGSVTGLVQADLATEFGTSVTSGEAETAITATGLGALTTAVTTSLLDPVFGALNTALSLAGASLTVNGAGSSSASSAVISVDLAPVNTLLTSTTTDGVVTVNLANGQVTIDIGKLSGGLEDRPANTELLTDAQVLDISARVNTLLLARIASITTALTSALDAATVTVNLTVLLRGLGIDVLRVQVGYTGTLKQFVDGTATTPLVTVTGPTVTVLGSNAVSGILNSLGIAALLTGLLGTVSATTTAVLNAAQAEAYDELLGAQLTAVLSSATGLLTTAMGVLSPLLQAIGTLLSITLNVQPDRPPTSTAPNGQYSVSALRISAVNATTTSSLLNLWFATSSVGANAT